MTTFARACPVSLSRKPLSPGIEATPKTDLSLSRSLVHRQTWRLTGMLTVTERNSALGNHSATFRNFHQMNTFHVCCFCFARIPRIPVFCSEFFTSARHPRPFRGGGGESRLTAPLQHGTARDSRIQALQRQPGEHKRVHGQGQHMSPSPTCRHQPGHPVHQWSPIITNANGHQWQPTATYSRHGQGRSGERTLNRNAPMSEYWLLAFLKQER